MLNAKATTVVLGVVAMGATATSDMSKEQVVVGVMAIAFCVDKVLGHLKSRGIDLREMSNQLDDLHEWHNVRDEDGILKWHITTAIKKNVDHTHTLLIEMSRLTKATLDELHEMKRNRK